jgi:hypothetical protein
MRDDFTWAICPSIICRDSAGRQKAATLMATISTQSVWPALRRDPLASPALFSRTYNLLIKRRFLDFGPKDFLLDT